ncbi:MAG: hypothetical protein ABI771_11235 [Betaproteobacteria bacterium]
MNGEGAPPEFVNAVRTDDPRQGERDRRSRDENDASRSRTSQELFEGGEDATEEGFKGIAIIFHRRSVFAFQEMRVSRAQKNDPNYIWT